MSTMDAESEAGRQRALLQRCERIAREFADEAYAREIAHRIVVEHWEEIIRPDAAAAMVRDLDGWLATAARRTMLDDQREAKRRRVREEKAAVSMYAGGQMHMRPDLELEVKELDELIARTLAAMPAQRREDYQQVMAGGDGAAIRVAAARGVSVDAVHQNVSRVSVELLEVAKDYVYGSGSVRGRGKATEGRR